MLMEGSLWFAFGWYWPRRSHGYVIYCIHIYFNEDITRFKVYWKSNPGFGIEPMPTALASSILTTGPQGRSPDMLHHWITQVKWSCSVMSDSLQSYGLEPTMLFHPWDFPGKSTGMGCHFLILDNPKRVSNDQPKWKCSTSMNCDTTARKGDQSKNGAVEEELAGRMLALLPFERV